MSHLVAMFDVFLDITILRGQLGGHGLNAGPNQPLLAVGTVHVVHYPAAAASVHPSDGEDVSRLALDLIPRNDDVAGPAASVVVTDTTEREGFLTKLLAKLVPERVGELFEG